MDCPWGIKALGKYLGDDRRTWEAYDTTVLVGRAQARLPVLVDQGDADDFLSGQLKTDRLVQAAAAADYPMTIHMQPCYDHSYFFIASFIEQHIKFHAEYLKK